MSNHYVIINKDESDYRFRELGFSSSKESAEYLMNAYKKLYKFKNLEIQEIENMNIIDKPKKEEE